MLCPTCKKEEIGEYVPFCSKRCEQIDLYKWLNEEYRVEAIELDDIDEKDMQELEEAMQRDKKNKNMKKE